MLTVSRMIRYYSENVSEKWSKKYIATITRSDKYHNQANILIGCTCHVPISKMRKTEKERNMQKQTKSQITKLDIP